LSDEASVSELKKCPFCAESIQLEAVVCRYCHRDLTDKGRNTKALVLIVGVVIFVALGAAYYFSPYFFLNQLKSAMEKQSATEIASLVDFPSVRESVKTQMMTQMNNNMQSDASMKNNPFAKLGMVMGAAIVNQLVDLIVTPSGLAALLKGKSTTQFANEVANTKDNTLAKENEYTVAIVPQEPAFVCQKSGYTGLNQFAIDLGPPHADKRLTVELKRKDLFSWSVCDVQVGDSTREQNHVYMTAFVDKSSAQAVGAQEFDEVVAIDNQPTHSVEDAIAKIKGSKNPAEVAVWRGDQSLEFNIPKDKENRIGVVLMDDTDTFDVTSVDAETNKGLGCNDLETVKAWSANPDNFDAGAALQTGRIALIDAGAFVILGQEQKLPFEKKEIYVCKAKIVTGNLTSNSPTPSKVWWIPSMILKPKNKK
jgi:hypothetical protein